jgi:hypothetical protein
MTDTTALAGTQPAAPLHPWHRIGRVVRMQLINRQTFIWVPLIILGGSFVLSLAIFAIIPVDEPKYGGASQAPLWYFFAVGIQALTLTFPFSQAMSVTRREFFVGTNLTAALTSAILAAVFIVGGLIEGATHGWGMNGYYFRLDWVWEQGPAVAGLLYFLIALLLFLAGFAGATIYKRFGVLWITVVGVGLSVVVVALVALLTWTESWGTAWDAVAGAGPLGLAAWIAAAVVVLGGVSFLILRRATP